MADRQTRYSATTMLVVIVLALAVLAVAAWQLGAFERGTDEGMRTAYEAGVTDESGGELIVTDPDAPRIEDLELPETPMTPVPAGEEESTAPAGRSEAE